MKTMKKTIKFLSILGLFAITACSSGVSSSSISDIDKAKPTNTELEYTDYGNQGNEDWDQTKWYKNELKDLPLPDPAVLEDDGVYYIYGTTDRSAARTFDCFSTTDFNNFTLHSNIYAPSSNSYTKESLFAPEVYKIDGKYYLYYSGKKNGESKSGINVLVSDSPKGPLKD